MPNASDRPDDFRTDDPHAGHRRGAGDGENESHPDRAADTADGLDIGLVGLAVMGQNLVLNMDDHGFRVGVHNRTTEVMTDFLAGPAADTAVEGFEELGELVAALERPRRVILMVKAGEAVDAVLEQLVPLLGEGDVVVDGGNSNFHDTRRRSAELAEQGIEYLGTGVSGGEAGARHGPSIMPGGSRAGWERMRPVLQAIAAEVDGTPCCDYLGEDGAGHFVKMVHNGIEYGDMQLIAEAYHLMDEALGMKPDEIAEVFARWSEGPLGSYLIEITAEIFRARDDDGEPLIEKILDAAGQKGTGKWTAINALEQGIPLTLIGEAVFARFLSALLDERREAADVLRGPEGAPEPEREAFLDDLERALYAAKIGSYAQGYMLMRAAADAFDWNLDYAGVAQLWRGGCIIRSRFLDDIMEAYREHRELTNLLLAPFFRDAVHEAQGAWRRVVASAARRGVPVPATASALSFFDGYRRGRLPANLIQAQRDYFGAHTYERLDRPRGEHFHTDWTGAGGEVTSGSYEA